MPSTPTTASRPGRKAKSGGTHIDEDDRIDYANEPLERSRTTDDSQQLENDSPFRDAGAENVSVERSESAEEISVPRKEVPIEELLAPPKHKGEWHSLSFARSPIFV